LARVRHVVGAIDPTLCINPLLFAAVSVEEGLSVVEAAVGNVQTEARHRHFGLKIALL
jgi:hypothetical protein